MKTNEKNETETKPTNRLNVTDSINIGLTINVYGTEKIKTFYPNTDERINVLNDVIRNRKRSIIVKTTDDTGNEITTVIPVKISVSTYNNDYFDSDKSETLLNSIIERFKTETERLKKRFNVETVNVKNIEFENDDDDESDE